MTQRKAGPGADLFHARLSGQDLSGSNLKGANMALASLKDCKLVDAVLAIEAEEAAEHARL